MPHILTQQAHIIFIIFLHAFVKERYIVERIHVDFQLTLVILRKKEITFKVIFSMRSHLPDHFDELFPGHDKHAHADKIVFRSNIVHSHVTDLAVIVQLQRQLMLLFAISTSGFGNHCYIASGCHMLIQHKTEINGAQHRGIGQNNVVGVTSLQNRKRCLQCLKLAAVSPGMASSIRRQETHAVAKRKIPLLTAAEVVHQRLIVVFCNNADVTDAGVCHIRQNKVNLAVAAAERDGSGSPFFGQLTHIVVVNIRENDAHGIHSSDTSFLHCGQMTAPASITSPSAMVLSLPTTAILRSSPSW